MQNRIDCCSCAAGGRRAAAPRFPGIRNRFTIGWRDVIAALVGPASRLHRYRHLRAASFDAASKGLDEGSPEE